MEVLVAFHLGEVSREFTSGQLDEDMAENVDETHFVINMDNGRTLGFQRDQEVRYADVVSGGQGMTMIVRLSGGRNAQIETPMLIFQNKDRSYPIRGVPDNIPGACYRTGPKGWNDSKVFPLWCKEKRAIARDLEGHTRILYMDNCSCHNNTPELGAALREINSVVRKLPPNSTYLSQPCDSFVIEKIKQEWRNGWDAYKLQMIQRNMWSEGFGELLNPGKNFFLKLAADSVRKVNAMRDKHGLPYTRKAMIQCGLAKNVTGQWEVTQLFPQL
ncbi:hypothetical protein R1sor_018053 [Riccia sorocarpa]|uniref:DDE-1 domain-containing protein n=1 Tax=Riccia sorocarpa TaxID=122646 RepID=A0ABD3ICM2_9MARC